MIRSIRDIPVYYEEYGEGKPVLCIHGYCLDHRYLTGCLEPVFNQKSSYRRIYPDLPGMGKTPSERRIKTSDDMLGILVEFIGAVIPDENFLIAGQSYGGYLTLGLMREFAERIDGVILICPQTKSWKIQEREKGKLPEKKMLYVSEDLAFAENEPDFKSFLDYAVIAAPEIYERYKNDVLSGVSAADNDFLFNCFDGAYSQEFEEDLGNIEFDKPVSIITGRQDNAVGFSDSYALLERFPRASFAVLDCAGHNLPIENEPLFSQLVKDWLWRIELK